MFTNYLTCPKCGSTAQPKMTTEIKEQNQIIQSYTCGCGCNFKAVYKIKEVYVTIERSDNDD